MKLLPSLLWAGLVALTQAQSAFPVRNNTKNGGPLPPVAHPLPGAIVFSFTDATGAAVLHPLTQQAKDRVPHAPNSDKGIHAHLAWNTPDFSKNLSHTDFAFTDCDPNSQVYNGMISQTDVIQDAIQANVRAIIFYTTKKHSYCKVSSDGYGNFNRLYSLETHKDTLVLLHRAGLKQDFRRKDEQTIWTYASFQRWNREQNLGPFGGAGSTAVAMIILYSITGVITALFLIIIVTGAIRAHRHPERYGPRNMLGRPRQSRAKGIARAMLDTIPIVKFGEREPDATKEVETGSSIVMESQASRPAPTGSEPHNSTQTAAGVSEGPSEAASSSAPPPPAPAQADSARSPTADDEEGLGCSICTEDFERGQDIRVLPCNHKFHPACVDPWLLDVSGTCPLCRVDLNPDRNAADGEDSDALPPPLDPDSDESRAPGPGWTRRRDTIRGFVSSRLNRSGLQGTSREERLEILRRWREAHASSPRARAGSAEAATGTTATASAPAQEDAQQTEERQSRLSRFSRLVRRQHR